MTTEALLQLPGIVHHELLQHLLREPNGDEQAAFVFARFSADDNTFHFVEWLAVPPDGFAVQLPYHFELTDATRAQIVKRAHDRLGLHEPLGLLGCHAQRVLIGTDDESLGHATPLAP